MARFKTVKRLKVRPDKSMKDGMAMNLSRKWLPYKLIVLALLWVATPALANDISNGSYSTTDGGNTAAPPNGWPAGMFPSSVEPSARANMGATKRWWERENPSLSTTGSAGHYVITPSNASYPTAYTQGEVYCAKANFTSVGNDDLNVNALGAKPIYTVSSSVIIKIAAKQILTGTQFCVSYDGALNSSAGGFQLQSPFNMGCVKSGQFPVPATTGYCIIPGGLIVQFTTLSGSGGTWTFDIPFPNGVMFCSGNALASGTAGAYIALYPQSLSSTDWATTNNGFNTSLMCMGY